jgi:TolA-binding protein
MKYFLMLSAMMGLGAAAGPVTTTVDATAADRVHAVASAPARDIVSWAPSDVADSLWREARRAVADEDWERAVTLFQRLRDRYPKSAYVGDSYYWQAFALYQKGGVSDLRRATELLDTQRADYASAATLKNGDARQLATRIRGMRAQAGDEASAANIARSAADAARSVRSGSASAGTSGGGRSRSGEQGTGPCKSEDEDDRVEALNALLQMRSEDALPILKQVLARRDACSEILRRKAVFLVSQKRGDEAADILLDAAKNDPDRETREQAVFWLGHVNAEKATGLLEQILKTSTDEDMQDKALFALSQSRSTRGQQVLRDYAAREDAPGHLREQAIFWIGQQRYSEENGQFLKQLFLKTKNEDVQQKILFSLSQTRASANSDWILDQAVNTKNSTEVRKQALFWGAQSGGVDVAKLGSLYDKSSEPDFREQVIFVLSQRSRSSEAVDKLIDIAKNDKDHEMRKKALFWLGQSRDPRVMKALQEIINR